MTDRSRVGTSRESLVGVSPGACWGIGDSAGGTCSRGSELQEARGSRQRSNRRHTGDLRERSARQIFSSPLLPRVACDALEPAPRIELDGLVGVPPPPAQAEGA